MLATGPWQIEQTLNSVKYVIRRVGGRNRRVEHVDRLQRYDKVVQDDTNIARQPRQDGKVLPSQPRPDGKALPSPPRPDGKVLASQPRLDGNVLANHGRLLQWPQRRRR